MARIRSLAVTVLTLAGACSVPPQSAADFEVVAGVRRYNEALARAYANASSGVLVGAATPDELQRVDDLIGFLAQGKMVMDARQERFEAGRVQRDGPDRATVDATEVWWYRHWIPATGEVKQAPKRVRYRNRYQLVRADGRWLVDRLRETGYEELK